MVVPGIGLWRYSTEVQLSDAVTSPVKSGITALQLPSAAAVLGSAHLAITGLVVSLTVKVVVDVELLPDESVAVMVTKVVPMPTRSPAAGLCVLVIAPLQLSVDVAAAVQSGMAALQFAPTAPV